MKRLLFLLLLALSVNVSAQDTSYARIFEPLVGELNGDYPVSDADVVWDDGLITTGLIGWEYDSYLARIDPNGNLLWQKEFSVAPGPGGFDFNEIITTRDSNFVAVGKIRDLASGEYRPYCMKLNAAGDTVWSKAFSLMNQSIGNYGYEFENNGHVVETVDSMLLIGFHHSSYQESALAADHFCLNKLTMNGDVLWSKSFLTDSAFYLTSIRQATDSSIYLIGNSRSHPSYGYVVNLSDSGQINWTFKYDGIQLHDMELDSSQIYVGWTDDTPMAGVLKMSHDGVQMNRVGAYSNINWYMPNVELARRSNGTIVMVPVQAYDSYGGELFEMNENLDYLASAFLNLKTDEVITIPNKGIYSTGYGPFYGVKTGDTEMGVIRCDSSFYAPDCFGLNSLTLDDFTAVQVDTIVFTPSDSIASFHLPFDYQPVNFVSEDGCVTFLSSVAENEVTWNETIAPNPSNGQFTISWGEYREVELFVFNSLGMEVYRGETKDSAIEIDLEKEQNGLYYYRLNDAEGSQSSGILSLLK